MNLKIKLKFPILAFCVLLGQVPQAMADNPMKDIFSDMMTNSTSATSFNTAKRFGATGGGFTARVPRVTPNIIAVVPPKLNVGCGGMDFFTGSFSIINKDQMVQVMRGIANGAATYAFSVGMQAVCATCMSTLESLSNQLNKFNADSRDACQKTYSMLSEGLGAEGMNFANKKSLFDPQNVVNGIFSDYGTASSTTEDSAKKALEATPEKLKDAEYNLVWDQLGKHQIDSWVIDGVSGYNWRELMQSMLGTVVVKVKASQGNEQAQVVGDPFPPTMTAKDLLLAADTVTVLHCTDSAKCMAPVKTTVSNWKGLSQVISARLSTLHTSLANRRYTALSADDQKFLNVVDASFVAYLERTTPGHADGNIALYSQVLANEVIAHSIGGFIARLQNWMGVRKSDSQVQYMKQLDAAMQNLSRQMEEMSASTAMAQQRLYNNFAYYESVAKTLGPGQF